MAAIACTFPDKNAAIRELEKTRNSGEAAWLAFGMASSRLDAQKASKGCGGVSRRRWLGERNIDDSRLKEFTVAFASGSTSGILAAIVTQPFDLIKTRLQAEAENRRTQSSTLQIWRQIAARDGSVGLFRGLSPRVAKVAPACGIMIASFEFVGRWLEENR
ncbi:hypothetical protein L7F22_046999 [Adiantum nelumboides]|nr:hypothetical protein [Adiantum nelumboides]